MTDDTIIPPEPDETPDTIPVLPDSWPFKRLLPNEVGAFWIAYLAPVLWLYAQLGTDLIRWVLA